MFRMGHESVRRQGTMDTNSMAFTEDTSYYGYTEGGTTYNSEFVSAGSNHHVGDDFLAVVEDIYTFGAMVVSRMKSSSGCGAEETAALVCGPEESMSMTKTS